MLAALIVGAALRVVGWLALRHAFFCGIPGFEDAIHHGRCIGLLTGGFPESTLPWGSPLYPYIMAFLSTLVGTEASRILMLQVLLGIATIPLVAWAFAPLLSRRGRWIAALIYALHPIGLFFEMRLQPVAPAMLLFLPALRLLFLRPGAMAATLLGGLALGVGFLLKPLLFFALAVAAVWMRLRPKRRGSDRGTVPGHPWTSAAAVTVAFLLLPVVMCLHNASLDGGGPTWNWSDAHGFHRTLSNKTWGASRAGQPPVWEEPGSAHAIANEALGRRLSEWETATFYRDRALQQLVENPLHFVGSAALRAFMLLSKPEIPDPVSATYVLGTYARSLTWGLHLFPLYLLLAALGLWHLRNRREGQALGIILLAVFFTNVLGTYSAASRWFFLIAMIPAAAVGIEILPGLITAARRQRGPRYLLAGGLALLVISALDLPGGSRRYENRSEDLRYSSALAMKLQDRRSATGLLRQSLRENPGSAPAHADLARLLLQEDLREAARGEYQAALAIDPDNQQALYGLCEVLRQEQRLDEAESLAVRLVNLHPKHPLYLNQYGVIKMYQGEFAEARFLLRQALAIAPDYQVAQMNLRTVDEAEREAPSLAFPAEMIPPPESALWRLGQEAVQAREQKNWAAADSLTALGLEESPDEPLAWYLRGAFLYGTGRYDESIPLLTRVVEVVPGRALTTEMVVRALLAAGRNSEAEAIARASLEQAPDERNRQSIERMLESMDALEQTAP
jgi:tetratricopeptide (TPR) repeat protein